MPRFLRLLAVTALFALALHGCSEETITQPPVSPGGDLSGNLAELGKAAEEAVAGRYLVVLDPEISDAAGLAGALASRHGMTIDHRYESALKGFAGAASAEAAAALAAEPGVLRVEQDFRVAALAQTLPTGVDRIQVDTNPIAAIDGIPTLVDVDVAIIDTGLDAMHADLNVVGGVRLLGGTSDPDFSDDFGHGTHLAGIIGARDNSVGVVGVAPGARLWGVKVLDGFGNGLVSDVVAGLDWVTARAGDIEVATMSFGGVGWSYALHTAVQNCVGAGVVIVVAAGNQSRDIYGADGMFGTLDDIVPASFPEACTVSAMADGDGRPGGLAGPTTYGPDDSFAPFSNYARTLPPGQLVTSPGGGIDLLMPGVDILSTIPGDRLYRASGTSMAAAHAAGLAALQIAQYGRAHDAAQVAQIRQAMIDRAVAQDSPDGLALLNDPDPRPERIGWAAGAPILGDLAISAFTATPVVVQGGDVHLSATIANVGAVPVPGPISVRVVEQASGRVLVQRQVPGLAAGESRSASTTFHVGEQIEPGIYTLVCSHGYPDSTPANNSRSATVEVQAAMPSDETIGLYFDTAATDTVEVGVALGEHVTAYILYSNPELPDVRGFECGVDIVGASQAPYSSLITATFPEGAIDVGQKDVPNGTYNFIVGYEIPVPTSQTHNVLATLDILYLDSEPLDLFIRASVPESAPITGWPAVVLRDFTLRDVPPATGPGNPAVQINPGSGQPNTVIIDPEPDAINAPWHLQGQTGYSQTGNGDAVLTNMDPGWYTLTWLPVPQHETPAEQTLTLISGGSITFTGIYELIPEPELLGLFFDQAGTDTLATGVSLGQTVQMYVLDMNPSVSALRGFECGLDLVVPGGNSSVLTAIFPTSASDIGTKNPAAGTFEYIAGYSSPVPTSTRTVLVTLNLLFLQTDDMQIHLRASDPESPPVQGMPTLIREDFSLYKVPLRVDPAQPAVTIEAAGGPGSGSILMDPDPDLLNASWSLTGPVGTQTGSGDQLLTGLVPGAYQAVWDPIPGWNTPASTQLNLAAGDTLTITGLYTPVVGGDERLGLYFDTAGADTLRTGVGIGNILTMYVLYQDPTEVVIRGFECGLDIDKFSSPSGVMSIIVGTTFPVPAVNIGTNNTPEGIYNYVVGYSAPVPTTANTVVATLDLLFIESDDLRIFHQASDPESPPIVGLPTLIKDDYSTFKVDLAATRPQPAVTILRSGTQTGSITVDTEPNALNAPWTVDGPSGTFFGNGDQTVSGLAGGTYTVEWGPVAGWNTPAAQTVTLPSGGALTVTGTYTPLANDERFGLYFDTAGTDTLRTGVSLGNQLTMYLVYQEPSETAIRGFECGIDIDKMSSPTGLSSIVTTTFPIPATDIGSFNASEGVYNFVVGYSAPLPTFANTVTATLTMFFLDTEDLKIFHQASDPESAPVTGQPTFIRNDYTLYKVPLAVARPQPAVTIQTAVTPTGSITMDPEPNSLNASWTLSGPGGPYTGSGDQTVSGLAAGSYTAQWDTVAGWYTPSPQTVSLTSGGSLTITGVYTQIPVNDDIGLFWDTAGTETEKVMPWLTQEDAYIVYRDPSLPAIRGFECGFDLDVPTALPNKAAQFQSIITTSFPVQAIDIGDKDVVAGDYNFVVGFASPLPTGSTTVVATLSIFLLDQGSLDFIVRGSVPSSSPSGLPGVIREDYTVMEIPTAQPAGEPGLRINPPGSTVGTVTMDPNPDALNAPWTLNGPGGPYTGSGDLILNTMDPGIYEVTWGMVSGYITPPTEQIELPAAGAITFTGDYLPQPVNEAVGLFFDTAGTVTEIHAGFLDMVQAYVLYLEPSQPAVRGFECGFDLVAPVKDAQFSTIITDTYPVQALNLGNDDMAAGEYNFAVGFGSPLVTTQATVLVTMDIILLDQPDLEFYMRGCVPSSSPTGQCVILKEDFDFFDVPMAQPVGQPALRILAPIPVAAAGD